jgi:hypothetical protein
MADSEPVNRGDVREERDLSSEFFNSPPSVFMELLDKLGTEPVILRLNLSDILEKKKENEVYRFLSDRPRSGQKRRVIIRATQDLIDKNFYKFAPTVEWQRV